MKKIGQIR